MFRFQTQAAFAYLRAQPVSSKTSPRLLRSTRCDAVHRCARDRDDEALLQAILSSHLPGHFKTTHVRHQHVEQQHIRPKRSGQCQTRNAVVSTTDIMSPFRNQRGQRIGVGPMVVDNEHAKYVIIGIVNWPNVNRFTRSGGLKRSYENARAPSPA